MSALFGMKIVPHELAREVRTEFRVAMWPGGSRKKRKRWFVQRVDINRPGCFRAGDTFCLHHELVAKLKEAGQ